MTGAPDITGIILVCEKDQTVIDHDQTHSRKKAFLGSKAFSGEYGLSGCRDFRVASANT